MKIQYVVQTEKKKSRWAWESYFETEDKALEHYKSAKKDKGFSQVRIYWQGWNDQGVWETGPILTEIKIQEPGK